MSRTPIAPASPSILEDLPFAMARMFLSFRRFNERTLRIMDLKQLAPGMASILHAVEELGDCTVNCLVASTQLPNGTLTGLLDTLQREGHIERTRNPADGRSRVIRLTGSGKQLCQKLHIRHRMVMEYFGESLTGAEMEELTRLLEKATDCMREYPPGEDPPSPAKD